MEKVKTRLPDSLKRGVSLTKRLPGGLVHRPRRGLDPGVVPVSAVHDGEG